jgi:hypothetical protein
MAGLIRSAVRRALDAADPATAVALDPRARVYVPTDLQRALDAAAVPTAKTPPAFVAATGHINFATTNAVPALASVQAGDVLLAFAYGNSQVASVTPPDGTWTQILEHGTEPRGRVFVRTATGPLAAGTWTWSGSHNHTVVIGAWRGAKPPASGSGTPVTGSATTVNAPTANATEANALLVAFGFHTNAGTTAALAGMTSRRNAGAAVAGSVLADEVRATPGLTGTRAYTITPGPGTLLASSLILEPA